MWTVYDHPADYPEHFVARCWLVIPGREEPQWTNMLLRHLELEPLRRELARMGLVALARNEGDEPQIVETWL